MGPESGAPLSRPCAPGRDRRFGPRRRVGPARRGATAVLAVTAVLVVVSGCSSGGGPHPDPAAAPSVAAPGDGQVFVAIGGLETSNEDRDDLPDNWPQLVFASMSPGTVYVNFGVQGATAASAVADQLPQAAALHPTVATVWVESADVASGTAPTTYQAQLTQLVEGLRQAGAQRVLLLSPSASPTGPAGGLADSVAQVAQATGAQLVDLGDTSGRGDDAGQRAIAQAVEAALAAG